MRLIFLFTFFMNSQIFADVPDYSVWQCQNETESNTYNKSKPVETSTAVWDCEDIESERKEKFKDFWKETISYSNNTSIDRRAEIFLDAYNEECKDTERIERVVKELEKLKINGYRSMIQSLIKHAKKSVQYSNAKDELDKIRELANKLGVDGEKIISSSGLIKRVNRNNDKRLTREKACKNTDNRGEILKKNIRNQGHMLNCYTHAAADVLSHHTGELISALSLGINYVDKGLSSAQSDASPLDKLAYGSTSKTLEMASDLGELCLEESIYSSEIEYQKFSNLNELLKGILCLKENYDNNEGDKQYFCEIDSSDILKVFNLSKGDFFDVLASSTKDELYKKLEDKSCKGKKYPKVNLKVSEIVVERNMFGDVKNREAVLDEIDKQFDRGKILGIGYDYKVLWNRFHEHEGSFGHASTIVSRKWSEETETCMYLLRNSWGEDCDNYPKEYECERGSVWIPSEKLVEMTRDLQYVD